MGGVTMRCRPSQVIIAHMPVVKRVHGGVRRGRSWRKVLYGTLTIGIIFQRHVLSQLVQRERRDAINNPSRKSALALDQESLKNQDVPKILVKDEGPPQWGVPGGRCGSCSSLHRGDGA